MSPRRPKAMRPGSFADCHRLMIPLAMFIALCNFGWSVNAQVFAHRNPVDVQVQPLQGVEWNPSHGFCLTRCDVASPRSDREIVQLSEFLRCVQQRTHICNLEWLNLKFLKHFTACC